MKKTLFIVTMLFVNQLFSQSEIEIALNFQNTLRSYYYHDDLAIDNELSVEATKWARYLITNDIFKFENDSGENLFSIPTSNLPINYNPYLDASIGWAIDADDLDALNNILDPNYKYLGIGIAKSNDEIIVVVKYK